MNSLFRTRLATLKCSSVNAVPFAPSRDLSCLTREHELVGEPATRTLPVALWLRLSVIVPLAAVLLAACGGGEQDSGATSVQEAETSTTVQSEDPVSTSPPSAEEFGAPVAGLVSVPADSELCDLLEAPLALVSTREEPVSLTLLPYTPDPGSPFAGVENEDAICSEDAMRASLLVASRWREGAVGKDEFIAQSKSDCDEEPATDENREIVVMGLPAYLCSPNYESINQGLYNCSVNVLLPDGMLVIGHGRESESDPGNGALAIAQSVVASVAQG